MQGILSLAFGWYYHRHPVRMFKQYVNYASAFRESFSILFLLKTLFSPWKSIKDSYPQKGFNMQAILETFFINLTTRGIGAVIRLASIVAGVALQVILLAFFIVYFLWWMVFPIVLALLPFYVAVSFFI